VVVAIARPAEAALDCVDGGELRPLRVESRCARPYDRIVRIGLVALGAFVAATAAATAVGPPVIREPWTPLPCPMHPSSTLEIEGCLERDVTRSDRHIDTKVATVFRLIKRRLDREAFVSAEHSWLQYRRRSCAAAASSYRGGSAEPIAYLTCEKKLNARHVVDLADAEQMLHHG